MLKLGGARMLSGRDAAMVRSVLHTNPVGNCMVLSRVEAAGAEPGRLGAQLWGYGTRLSGLCFSGANLVPVRGGPDALKAFADRALREPRRCSSLVGDAELVMRLWQQLELDWGPAREIRPDQPLMAINQLPRVAPDPLVRPVRPEELERYLPAAVAMFTEEVGLDPTAGDGGAGYRSRVAEMIASGRAFARFEGGRVVFKAEIGSLSSSVGQIQGVWVHPQRRGAGLGAAGTAAVVQRLVTSMGRTASLYVNDYNRSARSAYARVGFREVGRFATVLF